ncbi:aminotransferase class III-fold pyridoxal phosphate-dependent enzyme [Hoeflea poritis]|uniref:Aminotransferase class III-fold pyridoxal phosphate-dependent enzyme n=1 Tax=Hoeflea poritis TaxID=2993659 RepID=A0ABT4VUD4_9HYPH|nr:aminotransferase class III-fold pyridoxal phosphate-dependent enzyme [Hoeflea poritis]MDA4848320.1 aminotransferase class III-fold pyridoxal phosphate-dependent enzyme [Hoeflea poritis]
MKDSNFLKENNAKFLWHPMGHPGQLRVKTPQIITGASGVRITDIDGHETVDAVGGLWNVNLGYSCDPVKQAISGQLDALPYYSAFAGTSNNAAIELSWELQEWFGADGLGRAFFTSGGSDSVETALRLARQYHKVRGEPGRTKFLSLKKGYHGTHMGGASVNGNARFRTAYEPMLPGCYHIPAPYTYRNPFNESDPARLAQLCAQALEDEIAFQGAETIAAFIMEPVLGAGGIIPPHESFMPMVREICTRNGIVLIADEVITGFGRTGHWSGSRHWGVKPDMMCLAKAITNGYFPFGAAMISETIAEAFEADTTGTGNIGHGYTYSAHPVGAAAAIACLAETKRLNVAENAAARGEQMFAGVHKLMDKHALIGDVRGGHGLMTAVELVSDRATKAPADKAVASTVAEVAYENGVMVRVSGHNILMSPPLIISEEDVDRILAGLDAGLAAAV